MILYQTENFGKRRDYRSNPHENWVIPPHIHEYSEIAFTKSGTTTVYLNGKKHLVPKDHLIFILPNQVHEYTDESASQMRCAVFSNDYVPFFFETIKDRVPVFPVLDLSDSPALLEALDQVSPDETLKICGILNLLCDRLLHSTDFVTQPKGEYSMLLAVSEYIAENFRKDIHLSDMAKKLGYHEKYLSSTLHARTNMNFRTFLSSYRVSYAKHLLRTQTKNETRISEIALQCGFSSINSFNRAFRDLTGMTPSNYAAAIDPHERSH